MTFISGQADFVECLARFRCRVLKKFVLILNSPNYKIIQFSISCFFRMRGQDVGQRPSWERECVQMCAWVCACLFPSVRRFQSQIEAFLTRGKSRESFRPVLEADWQPKGTLTLFQKSVSAV